MSQEVPHLFLVQRATTAALSPVMHNGYTLESTAMPPVALMIDGLGVTAGMWVLVKNQVDAKQNGLYQVVHPGEDGVANWKLQRVNPAASLRFLLTIICVEGEENQHTSWLLLNPEPITAGVDNLAFQKGSLRSNLQLPSSAPASPVATGVDLTGGDTVNRALTESTFDAHAGAINTNSTSIASLITALQYAGILA